MGAVSIVTISDKIELFKGEEVANAIELIEFAEYGFHVVANKKLYSIGDKAVYIEPDYCLSEKEIFESFIRPGGDPKKCILGANWRIRAKKFNLHKGDGEPVYSNGILLPINDVNEFLGVDVLKVGSDKLTELLGITKYEEVEGSIKGSLKTNGGSPFPSGVYKTDEDNFLKVINKLNFPVRLVGTEKVDGSSITFGLLNGCEFIGSRKLVKPLKIKKMVGYKKPNFIQELMMMFGWKFDFRKFEIVDNDDDFVKNSKKFIHKMKELGLDNILVRGELNGAGFKGSGNKNNPASKVPVNIKAFGVDNVIDGVSKKMSDEGVDNFLDKIGMERVKKVFNKEFNSAQELIAECREYFKENLIEGIVIRTTNSDFSAKIMNDEYDSKK